MFRSFRYSVKQAFVQTWRNKNMSIASIFSITAMLLILGLFFIIAINVNVMIDDAKKDFDTIEACLKDEVTVEQGQLMAEQMNADIDVKKAYYQTKDEALKNWREKKWGDNGYLLDGLNPNPLPNSVMIKVSDISKADSVVEKLSQYEGIEKIKYYKEVVDRLLKFSKNVQIGAFVLIVFLILVSIVVVANTIKLTVHARGREISIMKHVGATNWFVRAPFLFEGIIIGVLSSLISAGIIALIYKQIMKHISGNFMFMMKAKFVPIDFMMNNLIWIFVALGVSIGACGSVVSMRRFLDK